MEWGATLAGSFGRKAAAERGLRFSRRTLGRGRKRHHPVYVLLRHPHLEPFPPPHRFVPLAGGPHLDEEVVAAARPDQFHIVIQGWELVAEEDRVEQRLVPAAEVHHQDLEDPFPT